MKARGIFGFELAYQARRLTTWLIFAALTIVSALFVRGNFLEDALRDEFYLNAPFVIAAVTVFASLFWLLVAAIVTGEVAARDVQSGIHPLTYTAPATKAEYLGGRFLAAIALHALLLLGVPLGIVIAVYAPGVDAALIGPFRPAAFLHAYLYFALPNAFIGTAIQFACASLARQALAAYVGSLLIFFVSYGGVFTTVVLLERQDVSPLLDVFAQLSLLDMTLEFTPIEKNTRLVRLDGLLLWSRLLWIGVAVATLTFTYVRFRFVHVTLRPWWIRRAQRRLVRADGGQTHATPAAKGNCAAEARPVPHAGQTFGAATSTRQVLVLAWQSFRALAAHRGGLILLILVPVVVVAIVPQHMHNLGTPLIPRTDYVLTFLTAALQNPFTPWVIIPLLIVLYAGELAWRERDFGLGEITDAAPVREWVVFAGKFLGLSLMVVAWMAIAMLAGVLVQLRLGHRAVDLALYVQILFGLQLLEYLLFAALALVVQGLVSQKYLGHLAALAVYAPIALSPIFGLDHHLIIYGSGPDWSYTAMNGFGLTLGPWLWFKLYWTAWALLLAVLARLLWVRGLESTLLVRLGLARGRLTRPTAALGAAALGLAAAFGGFIAYNTRVLNADETDAAHIERRAQYERRYRRWADTPQPRLTAVTLHVEIYPHRRAAEIRGSYRLLNDTAAPIEAVHVATAPSVETGEITFDRRATPTLIDGRRGHRIYTLEAPLRPGDALQLDFDVHFAPKGFRDSGIDPSVVANGTYFTNQDWLPAIGYQARRELTRPGHRRAHGLAPRSLILPLAEEAAAADVTGESDADVTGADRIAFDAVVGTEPHQIAVAPGALRRTWTAHDASGAARRYFHYATAPGAPIGNRYAFFSAAYAVRTERWRPADSGPAVAIEFYHHPEHTANLERMLRSVTASLDYHSRQFGPYPFTYVRLVENPRRRMGAHSDAATIDYGDGFSLFDPDHDPRGLDFPFAIVAHEMAHQWWGTQLPAARMEGAGLLTESPAWYSAMGVVDHTYGREHLQRLLRFFRQPYPIAPVRQPVPLLRGADRYALYRRGPFALYALREYIGEERVNRAYRRLLEIHTAGAPPLPTSLDLYRELRAVTPESHRVLLHDLFAANTHWDLATVGAQTEQTADGAWQVTLRVRARKVVLDPAGVETELPMDDLVQVGAFAPTDPGADFGETLYLQMHRIRSGEQTIRLTVPRRPSDAGIDPFHLLVELERFDNVEEVSVSR